MGTRKEVYHMLSNLMDDKMSSKETGEDLSISGVNMDLSESPADDQILLIIAKLMEGGQEDEDTCRTLDSLTKLLTDDSNGRNSEAKASKPLYEFVDMDGFETIMDYLDMRQKSTVRGHATLTASAYLKASSQTGVDYLTSFFQSRVSKATYDDFIVVFSVAESIFPVVPALSAELFLSDGFVNSLGPLMKRKWKSRKVEQACLEMLNVACMNSACREAIQRHCTEWLEEIISEDHRNLDDTSSPHLAATVEDGPLQQRVHSELVKELAAVILAKLQAVPISSNVPSDARIQPASTSMEDLSDMFTKMLATTTESSRTSSIEGLAYASLQPAVKEKLASNSKFLINLINALSFSPAKSPATYGGLSILVNLTSYLPTLSEEQERMHQLKAYANASKTAGQRDPLDSDEQVLKRGQAVFNAGAVPVLVTHSQHGSIASLNLVVSIIFALSKNTKIRGKLAQQGGIKLLLHAYAAFPETNIQSRRITAHAMARILISTNPVHVFGGSNPQPLTSVIRPLLSLLADDPTTEHRDLLPTFESLLALTNLASTDDSARNPIIRHSWPAIEELLLSNNTMIMRATVELICNLMQSPEGIAKFADGGKQASQRMHILLALADSEDFATRRAAGGALASLTEWDTAVNAILERNRGVNIILQLCKEDEEELRHRGAVSVLNIVSVPGKVGEWGLSKIKDAEGVEALKECLKKSRSQEVLEITVEALKKLMTVSETAAVS